uniref:glutathione transferase n=1 Tax=Fagopyrum esculentum subsp. esculentum TaxID=1050352 RepID=A0A455R535_FAGES|nr:glutathione S-transferase [Fagopyrum esculentum subsp. esculentum]
MAVKVYGAARAACPQRVLACLMELEVEFELIHVDLDFGEHKSPEFLTRQPFGQVPVIEDGDLQLYESRAIIRYIAGKYPDKNPKLLGTTLKEKAMVDQWLEVEAHNFNDLVYSIVLQLLVFPRMGRQSDMAVVESCKLKLEKVLDVYEQRLSDSNYLAGSYFTLADLTHLPGIRYLTQEAGLGYLVAERKNVAAWWEDISSRAAWKKVLQMAQI